MIIQVPCNRDEVREARRSIGNSFRVHRHWLWTCGAGVSDPALAAYESGGGCAHVCGERRRCDGGRPQRRPRSRLRPASACALPRWASTSRGPTKSRLPWARPRLGLAGSMRSSIRPPSFGKNRSARAAGGSSAAQVSSLVQGQYGSGSAAGVDLPSAAEVQLPRRHRAYCLACRRPRLHAADGTGVDSFGIRTNRPNEMASRNRVRNSDAASFTKETIGLWTGTSLVDLIA